jgi:hypothetical protein
LPFFYFLFFSPFLFSLPTLLKHFKLKFENTFELVQPFPLFDELQGDFFEMKWQTKLKWNAHKMMKIDAYAMNECHDFMCVLFSNFTQKLGCYKWKWAPTHLLVNRWLFGTLDKSKTFDDFIKMKILAPRCLL